MTICPVVPDVYRAEYEPALDFIVEYVPPEDVLDRTEIPSTLIPLGVFASVIAGRCKDRRIDTFKFEVEEQMNRVVLLLPQMHIKLHVDWVRVDTID